MKTTKRALLTSVMALILCFSMLVGTTFAWFTDEVKSGVNQIVAGNLDIELYNSLTVGTDKVTEETKLFEEITYWEPGVVAYENLTVANMGTLALQYQLSVNFANATTNANGETLAEVLRVGFVEGGIKTTDRTAALNMVDTWLPLESFAQEGRLVGAQGEVIDSKTYGIVIYWQPSERDNEFNMNNGYEGEPLSIDLGISLYATQLQAEMDSFGPDYDEESAYIIAAGDTANFAGATFNSTVSNYGTVEFIGGEMNTPDAALDNYGTATLDGVNMVAGSPTDYAIRAGEGSETVLNDVTMDAKGGAIGALDGAQLTINGGSVAVNSTSTSGRYNIYAVGEGTVVTINGGTYSFSKALNQKRAYIYAGAGATVYVNGGTFGKASTRSGYAGFMGEGTIVVTGGTFGFNPTKWVATGCEIVENADKTWTVLPMNQEAANQALKDALANGETDITLAPGTYALPTTTGDVTISGTLDTVITINKPKAGNVTLKGVTVVGSGLYTGIQHSNTVVFEDCVVKGTQCLYADKVIFKNCVIDLTEKADYIWTYGAKDVEFVDCTFNTLGKAILVYSETKDLITQVSVKNCVFNASASALASGQVAAAIEIDSSLATNGHYTLITENNTVDADFAGEWRIKKSGTDNTTVNGVVYNAVTLDGAPVVFTAEELATVLVSDEEEINVVLGADIDLPITSLGQQTGGSGEYKLGGENTKAITININGYKLNITTGYWSGIGAKNDDAIFTIKNGTMTSSQATGTWNSYDVTFANCNYVIENVVFEKAIAFTNAGKNVNLTNVTINETHDYYALWISAKGQNVVINGLTVNSAGRGIKIDEQYVDAPAKVTLNISNAKFTTAKKAAVMVKSVEGAEIILNNVDITGVAADATNAVWVDGDSAAHAGKVTVNGAPAVIEP